MFVYKCGDIEVNPNPKNDNFDIIGLVMAGPSLKVFYEKCIAEYGLNWINRVENGGLEYKFNRYLNYLKAGTIDKL
jgi:hypothetical protein